MADLPDVLVQHPYRLELADLPVDIKKEMVRLAVEECREELGHKTADLLSEILERSCPMAEVARDSGVTRQAIHIRLAPAIKKIRKKLESMEIPNLDQL
jgi:DNA-directed RNA polymerase specialized sigma24 family protein